MANQIFMRVNEVAEELGVSVPYAYKLIRQMNEELAKTGCITISGRIDRKFFHEKFYGTRTETARKGEKLWQRSRTRTTAPGMYSSAIQYTNSRIHAGRRIKLTPVSEKA